MSSKSAPIIVYFAQGDPPQKNQHNWPPLMSVYNYEGRKNDHLMQLFSMLRKNLGKAKELLFKKSFEGCKIFCFRGGLQKVEFSVSHDHLASSPRLEICHDRRDRQPCKIFSSCVNFSRKRRVSLQNLCKNMKFTHLFDEFTQTFLQNFSNFTFSFPFQ